MLWTNVDGRVILEYLRHMQFPEVEDAAFDLDLVRQYIEKRVADGELEEWSVFVPTVQGGRPLEREVLGHEIRLPKRSRLVGVLSDPPHFMVDMPGGAGAYDSTEKMFDVRTVQNGLLIIYVVDKDSSATDEDRVALFDGYPDREHVVGLAFAFPRSSKAEKDNFMCVKGVSYE